MAATEGPETTAVEPDIGDTMGGGYHSTHKHGRGRDAGACDDGALGPTSPISPRR